jgi:hypothetical protein
VVTSIRVFDTHVSIRFLYHGLEITARVVSTDQGHKVILPERMFFKQKEEHERITAELLRAYNEEIEHVSCHY